jgi:sugar lactone lactonase YvrE
LSVRILRRIRVRVALLCGMSLVVPHGPAAAEVGDLVADKVFGEATFTDSVAVAIGPSTFALPRGIAIDRSVTPNRVYVSDSRYHRVLGWSNADGLVNGAPADLVIGQADFASFFCNRSPMGPYPVAPPTLASLCQPSGLAVDSAGNLYVVDTGNCRVLIFIDPFGTDQVADVVLGQADGTCGVAADRLYDPQGIAVDGAGNVYVADTLNARVLEFDRPLVTDQVADRVFGQRNFTDGMPNGSISFVHSVTLDGAGRLYAGAIGPVYIFDPPLESRVAYDHRLGGGCTNGGESASTTCGAVAVVADAAGRLYVGDPGNSRVLEFDSPLTVGEAARVFGQPGFGTAVFPQTSCNTGGPSASSLCLRVSEQVVGLEFSYHEGVALDLDVGGNLWVADTMNNRVLRYDNPLGNDNVADLVLGHMTMDDACQPVVTGRQPAIGLNGDAQLIVDGDGSRVLVRGYDTPIAVLGQPDFNTTGCNSGGLSGASLCNPAAALFDSQGNLWIADSGNNRVVEYLNPWLTFDNVTKQYVVKASADRVFGQLNLTSNACATGTAGLCNPRGLALDSQGSLFISDSGNNRVVRHQNPLVDTAADQVFGQSGSFTSNGCNTGGLGPNSLCDPRGLYDDSGGHLFVADHGNNRVLRFDVSGYSSSAIQVFGQDGSMNSNACAAGRGGLCGPSGVGMDDGANLLIADTDNSRVLDYNAPLTSDTGADRVFGQPDFDGTSCNAGGVSAESLCHPTGVVGHGSYDAIYVDDTGNQRILDYYAPYCLGDFQLTPTTRRLRVPHSGPRSTRVKVFPGADPNGHDLIKLSGRLTLYERDGMFAVGNYPWHMLTLSTSNGVLFRGEIAMLNDVRTRWNYGLWSTNLQGLMDPGVDQFTISDRLFSPLYKPWLHRYAYTGEVVGLDLSSFTETQATLQLQFGTVCFTTQLQCGPTKTGRLCVPARQ